MRKKILSLALALALCLGLTVPAFAAETYTETIDGITITATPDGTINYSGSGVLTEDHIFEGAGQLWNATGRGKRQVDAVINIGTGITADQGLLARVEELIYGAGVEVKSVKINTNSTSVPQTVGGFTDVKPDDYFADPVMWAVNKKITAGTSETTFSPNQNCTVAQILTFLWRANGSPTSKKSNPFSDVKSSDYYYNAARWAYEKGMVTGNTFGGDRPCTRSMAVTYMWKADVSKAFYIDDDGFLGQYSYLGDGGHDTVVPNVVIPDHVTGIASIKLYFCKSLTSVTIPTSVTTILERAFWECNGLTDVYYEGSEAQWKAIDIDPDNDELSKATIHYNSKKPSVNTGFTDVPSTADYAQAVQWAVEQGVTSGTSATTFSPDSVCTRGQIVTFLHRALAK